MNEVLPIDLGRYRLTERLAVGGMAVLYRATLDGAHEFRKHLVIKRIQHELAMDREFVAMFIDEAKITARLQHPKIVQVFELGTLENELFIAMELVEGTDLLEVMRLFNARKHAIEPRIATYIVREVLDALDYAHNVAADDGSPLGLVHRDISPGNVLISHRGDVKLADFGIAHAVTNQTKTVAGTLKGKYSYMAPEQIASKQSLDARADLFAVGTVLAEMLMGRRLFTAKSDLDILMMVRDANLSRLEEYGAHLDKGLLAILRRALQRERDARFQSAREMCDALEDWLFETHQRVAARDIAAMVEDVLRNRPRKPTPELAQSSAQPRPRTPTHATKQEAVVLPVIPLEESGGYTLELGPAQVPSPPTCPDLELSADDFGPSLELEPPTPRPQDETPLDLALATPEMRGSVPRAPTIGPEDESRQSSRPSFAPRGTPATHDLEAFPPRGSGPSRIELDPEELDDAVGFGEESAPVPIDDPAPVVVRFSQQIKAVTPDDLVEDPTTAFIASPAGAALQARTVSASSLDGEPDGVSDLSEIAAIRLLYGLIAQSANGLLVATAEGIEKRIYFVGGNPEYVESNQPDDLFGEILVGRGTITRGELTMAMAMLPHFEDKLGNALVGLGLMTPQQTFDALADQLRAKLEPVCTWTAGSFRWYRDRPIPREWQPLHVDLCAVIGLAIRGIGEETLVEWGRPHTHHVMRCVEKPRVPANRYQLGKRLEDIVKMLEDDWTLDGVRRLCPSHKAWIDTLRILYLMEQTDLGSWVRSSS